MQICTDDLCASARHQRPGGVTLNNWPQGSANSYCAADIHDKDFIRFLAIRLLSALQVGGASPQATDDEEDPPMLDATGIEDNDTASVKSAATVGSRLAPSYVRTCSAVVTKSSITKRRVLTWSKRAGDKQERDSICSHQSDRKAQN